MQIFLMTFIIFGLCVFALSIGVVFGKRCIEGSCGGMGQLKRMFGLDPCATCPVAKRDSINSL